MSLLYDSHDSRVLREHGAASEAGLNGPQHPGSQGNVETFKLMSLFQPLPYIHHLPLRHLRTDLYVTLLAMHSRGHASTWKFIPRRVSLFLSRKPHGFTRYQKGGEQASGLVLCRFSFFPYLFMYFIRMSFKWKDEHLHDNRAEEQRGSPRERQYP